MPNDEVLYRGKRKEDHLKDAVGAIVAATTPYGRYRICKEGFLKFEPIARRQFREEANIPFTSVELRVIFDSLKLYIDTKERHLRASCRKQYTHERRQGTQHHLVDATGREIVPNELYTDSLADNLGGWETNN